MSKDLIDNSINTIINEKNIEEEHIEEGIDEENIEDYKLSKFLFYNDFIKLFPNYLKFDPNLPDKIRITTSTLIITYPLEFNIKNIADNIILSNNFINSIKLNNSTSYYRTIKKNTKKRTYSKQKKITQKETKRKNFYNHISLEINNKKENIKLNIKIFQNKSLQITGLKKISWLFWALYNIFNYMSFKSNNIIFALPIENIKLDKMEKFYVVMINCIFEVGFNINLLKLYNIVKDKYDTKFDTSKHCALNISYKFKFNDIDECSNSVIIYNNGKILLSAKENYEVIINCYKDISLLLLQNYNNIVLETFIVDKQSKNIIDTETNTDTEIDTDTLSDLDDYVNN